jgi:hypothetical protein
LSHFTPYFEPLQRFISRFFQQHVTITPDVDNATVMQYEGIKPAIGF